MVVRYASVSYPLPSPSLIYIHIHIHPIGVECAAEDQAEGSRDALQAGQHLPVPPASDGQDRGAEGCRWAAGPVDREDGDGYSVGAVYICVHSVYVHSLIIIINTVYSIYLYQSLYCTVSTHTVHYIHTYTAHTMLCTHMFDRLLPQINPLVVVREVFIPLIQHLV